MNSPIFLISISALVDEINQDCEFCYNFFSHNDIIKTVKIIEKVLINLNDKKRKPINVSIVNVSDRLRQYGTSHHIMKLSYKEYKNLDSIVDDMVNDIINQMENDLYF